MFNKINNPILFQGDLTDKNYFEGWYFKQVSADCKSVLSLIPGISLFEGDPHSFVQYIYKNIDENGIHTLKTGYCRYAATQFSFSQNPFEINVGDSTFSEKQIIINLQDNDFKISGVLELGDFNAIEKSFLMPNIMGFFAYIPKMQCYHGIISMDHTLQGSITVTASVPDSATVLERKIDFSNGKGYIEKDWGTSFPKEYIWGQCNHFSDEKASLVFSVADIPFAHTSFRGFLCNLFLNNEEYRFATYNSSKCKITFLSHQKAILKLENKKARLVIEALISDPGELIAPVLGNMIKPIKEELSGDVNFTLFDKKTQKTYEECGKMAGIEIVIDSMDSKLL